MRRLASLVLGVVIAGAAGSTASPAQTVDKRVLSLAGARAVAAAAEAEAKKNNAGGAIAVLDDGGNLLFL